MCSAPYQVPFLCLNFLPYLFQTLARSHRARSLQEERDPLTQGSPVSGGMGLVWSSSL